MFEHNARLEQSLPTPFVYNGVTGLVKQELTSGYRWTLRRIRDVQYVKIVALHDGGALVDVTIDDYTIMRETWANYDLACKRYRRWSQLHGFRINVPDLREPRTYVFDVNAGRILYPVASGYRWALRHMDEVHRVEVLKHNHSGKTTVTLYVNGGRALRETWESCALANKRYIRWSMIHGFVHKFYNMEHMSSASVW